MKKITVLIFVVSVTLLFCACARQVRFKNIKQYEEGKWEGRATISEVARIKGDKLAFEKMAAADSQSISKKGFLGFVFNQSHSAYVNLIIRGPEKKAFYLEPRGKRDYNLIPGLYTATQYDEHGNIRGNPWIFHVGPQTHDFLGEEVYWYVVTSP